MIIVIVNIIIVTIISLSLIYTYHVYQLHGWSKNFLIVCFVFYEQIQARNNIGGKSGLDKG